MFGYEILQPKEFEVLRMRYPKSYSKYSNTVKETEVLRNFKGQKRLI